MIEKQGWCVLCLRYMPALVFLRESQREKDRKKMLKKALDGF